MHRILVSSLLLACGLAHAMLEGKPGADPGAVVQRKDAVTSVGASYAEVTRTLATGTVVREYTDASGTVFAVSWSGPYKPDLQRLLGRHFAFLRGPATGKGRGPNRSHMQVDTGELVVRSAGHMGAYQGRAWLQSRVPAGFDPQEMK